ncbi:LysM peptidoglycan-binding domain-containing protein [Desulfohalobiaceae bacterium Ax17]|uniref:LysM peptidoglycan-binding domain-containing protein n=1 Tax=Desulfovulcanus ferrireducens TaxID=2831190 RepID=UPI00207BCDD9|nr:LysM peptidoglycan-binding domain-containing protein [Desulfovulcanus ferrireducens]MBT8762412.1 LysM peptidoglycan-binding domain-containing protein [Desulfovulcanus ferrireducens]
MKKIILFSIFTLIWTLSGYTQKPPRLVFEKKISINKKKLIKHKIKKGEWLYKILRNYNVSTQDIPYVIRLINELNPHIKNLSKLKPGQTLLLPLVSPPQKTIITTRQTIPTPESVLKKSYIVKSGDNLVKILRNIAHLPDKLIFNEYINLFKKINPQIKSINSLKVGQKILLPLPPEKKIKGIVRTVKKNKRSTVQSTHKTITEKTIDQANCELFLKKLGFQFISGDSVFFPQSNGTWFKLDLTQTPLVLAPWGEKLLFVTNDFKYWKSRGKEFEFTPLFNSDWQIHDLLLGLKNKFSQHIKVWASNRPFLFQTKNISLEIVADYIVKVDDKLFIMNIFKNDTYKNKNNLAYSLLKSLNIEYIAFFSDQKSKYHTSKARKILVNKIFAPKLNSVGDFLNVFPELKTGKNLYNLKSLISHLEGKKIINRKRITLNLLNYKHKKLYLYIDCYIYTHNGQEYILIEDDNPVIIALIYLNQKRGYILNL